MLCAIERTSVWSAIEACRSFCESCWQGLKPFDRSTSSRAGIEPFGLVEHGLELRRQDQMREQLLAGDEVGIGLFEEHDRVRIEDEAGLAPIGRRLRADIISAPA